MSSSRLSQSRPSIHTDPTSLLFPLSFTDTHAIRLIQTVLQSFLKPSSVTLSPPLGIPHVESAIIAKIIEPLFPTHLNPLYAGICERFASAYCCSDELVIKAARHFDFFAIESVWNVDKHGGREYGLVKLAMEGLLVKGEMSYEVIEGGDEPYPGKISQNSELESGVVQHEDHVWHAEGEVYDDDLAPGYYDAGAGCDLGEFQDRHDDMLNSGMTQADFDEELEWLRPLEEFEVESPAKGGQPHSYQGENNYFLHDEDQALGSQNNDNDHLGGNDSFDVSEGDKALVEEQEKRRKHAAVRNKGEKFVKHENYDRTPALCNGVPQRSKVYITFQTQKPDPENPDNMVPCPPAEFKYSSSINWSNKASISRLNRWRSQIYLRALGPYKQPRCRWTLKEHDHLLQILRKHVDTPAVNRRYSHINWEFVVVKFNQIFEGHLFEAGELLAPGCTKNKPKFGEEARLKQDSKCNARTVASIKDALAHFTSDEAKEFMKLTKEAAAVTKRKYTKRGTGTKAKKSASKGFCGLDEKQIATIPDSEIGGYAKNEQYSVNTGGLAGMAAAALEEVASMSKKRKASTAASGAVKAKRAKNTQVNETPGSDDDGCSSYKIKTRRATARKPLPTMKSKGKGKTKAVDESPESMIDPRLTSISSPSLSGSQLEEWQINHGFGSELNFPDEDLYGADD